MERVEDRVEETTTSSGLGALVLAGRTTGMRSFAAAGYEEGDTFRGLIRHTALADEWEITRCIYTGGAVTRIWEDGFSRSSTGEALDFSTGLKTISVIDDTQALPGYYITKRASIDYTANPREIIGVDTRSGATTQKMPPNPALDDVVEHFDPFGTWATNSPIFDGNGQLLDGSAEPYEGDLGPVRWRFVGGDIGWQSESKIGASGNRGEPGPPGAAMMAPTKTITFTSNTYDPAVTDFGSMLKGSTGSGSDQTSTLPDPTDVGDGRLIWFMKSDAGTAAWIIKDHAGTELAHLMTQGDRVLIRCTGSGYEAVTWKIAPVRRDYTTSVTWKKRPLLQYIDYDLDSGGSGGGSGRRGANGTLRLGGGGAAPAGKVKGRLLASEISGDQAILIGAGATGGAAVTTDDTDGNPGLTGGDTTFGSLAKASAGGPGGGGTATAGAGGTAPTTTSTVPGVPTGGASSTTTTPTTTTGSPVGASGGAGGGALTAANAAQAGGSTGPGSRASNPFVGGATGGANTGANGTDGNSITDSIKQGGGSGGGGGGANPSGAGGKGGKGGAPGGGGGGGGAAPNGSASGGGGDGAQGRARLLEVY